MKKKQKPVVVKNEDNINFKSIGYEEKIFKFTDIYIPSKPKIRKDRWDFIEK